MLCATCLQQQLKVTGEYGDTVRFSMCTHHFKKQQCELAQFIRKQTFLV